MILDVLVFMHLSIVFGPILPWFALASLRLGIGHHALERLHHATLVFAPYRALVPTRGAFDEIQRTVR